MIFEFDRWASDRPYPNLARWSAQPYTPEWRQFSQHWPFSEPPMLWEYLQDEQIVQTSDALPRYLVAVSFFDFSIDWPSLLPSQRLAALRDKRLILIFYYSEGDHPGRMLDHLYQQFTRAGVDPDQLRLVSANSQADHLPRAVWLADDELLYRKRNRKCEPVTWHDRPRTRLFTALVRTHKWWRATIMADFWRRGWHEQGYFSYNPAIQVGDLELDNPIEVDRWPGLRAATHEFVKQGFTADNLSSDQHNDHHLVIPEHYENSYLNIVIETHMDVDQSGGVFLTEKTFKPIKNAQPFVIFGAAGSLARLRDLGYRTFDRWIDPAYDRIENTTDRYACIMDTLAGIFSTGHSGLHDLYCQCRDDIQHNQQHFLGSKHARLNRLLEQI
jgi:hypothetical protein